MQRLLAPEREDLHLLRLGDLLQVVRRLADPHARAEETRREGHEPERQRVRAVFCCGRSA